MTSTRRSLPPGYFDRLYQQTTDPWGFETSQYEAEKYARTLAALPRSRYQSGFEIGGSIGVLTAMLAEKCDALLSVDVSERAQQQAIERCQALSQVQFALMQVPEAYPEAQFDLTVLSEVGYYWCWQDLLKARQLMIDHLQPGGHLLLVHWTPYNPDYHNPLSGDQVHGAFLEVCPSQLAHLHGYRGDRYRLDLFERHA